MILFGWLCVRMFPSPYPCCMKSKKQKKDRKVGKGVFCKVKTISLGWVTPLISINIQTSSTTGSSLQPPTSALDIRVAGLQNITTVFCMLKVLGSTHTIVFNQENSKGIYKCSIAVNAVLVFVAMDSASRHAQGILTLAYTKVLSYEVSIACHSWKGVLRLHFKLSPAL